MILIKSDREIATMREGGMRLARVIEALVNLVVPGISTKFLDEKCREFIREAGGTPAFLGYVARNGAKPFPASLCVSVNEAIVHGIPSERVIQDGDLVKLDIGLTYRGFCVDAAVTVGVGAISREAVELLRTTRAALDAGIGEAWPGKTLDDVGRAIEEVVARGGFSIADSLTGHGIGRALHEDPTVFNLSGMEPDVELESGMALAIEPMVAVGEGRMRELPDGTFVSADGSLTAHFEHTVAVTKRGPLVLTKI